MMFHELHRTTLVVVMDAARARLFWGERTDQGTELREDPDEAFVHPAARLRPSERYSDSQSGGVVSPAGRHLGFDDHRNQKDLEERRRFAREVAPAIARLTTSHEVDDLIVVATHAEHALIVEGLERERLKCPVRHVVAEATQATAREVHDLLRARGLLH